MGKCFNVKFFIDDKEKTGLWWRICVLTSRLQTNPENHFTNLRHTDPIQKNPFRVVMDTTAFLEESQCAVACSRAFLDDYP